MNATDFGASEDSRPLLPANDPNIGIVAADPTPRVHDGLPSKDTRMYKTQIIQHRYNNIIRLNSIINSTSLSCRIRAISSTSISLIFALISRFKKVSFYNPYVKALSALVGDLLFCATADPFGYRHRSVGGNAFSKEPFGRKAFLAALNDLVAGGYVEMIDGQRGPGGPGTATRMRATGKLIEAALAHGINLNQIDRHFGFGPFVEAENTPVVMRGPATKYGKERDQGPELKLDTSLPHIRRDMERVNRFNRYIDQQTITPYGEWIVHRVYCDIGDPDAYGRFGGRLYGAYQNKKKKHRKDWRINGQPLIELDISGCFLTIYMHRVGQPLDPEADPYEMEWPRREIVKAYINGSLGAGKLLTQWPPAIVDRLENPKDEGVEPIPNVRKRFRIPAVRSAAINKHPSLQDIEEVGLRWGDLHNIESEVVFAVIERLAYDHNIAAIPIHDAIFVPVSASDVAKQILIAEFERQIGVTPKVKLKKLDEIIKIAV